MVAGSAEGSWLFRASECFLPELDPDELRDIFVGNGPSASGFDALLFDDFRWLPRMAFVYLCQLLTIIEQGAPWPQDLLHAKAHMLSKDASRPFDPLSYRLLLITSVIYRGWAKMRLQHLQAWISSWALPSIFGGIQGVGSAEAWYATAVDVEWAMTHNIPIIGAKPYPQSTKTKSKFDLTA